MTSTTIKQTVSGDRKNFFFSYEHRFILQNIYLAKIGIDFKIISRVFIFRLQIHVLVEFGPNSERGLKARAKDFKHVFSTCFI